MPTTLKLERNYYTGSVAFVCLFDLGRHMDTNLINPVSSLGSLRILLHKTTGANSRAGSNTVCSVDSQDFRHVIVFLDFQNFSLQH